MGLETEIKQLQKEVEDKYDPVTAQGNPELIKMMDKIAKLTEQNKTIKLCHDCDTEGLIETKCMDCDGTGTAQYDCDHGKPFV